MSETQLLRSAPYFPVADVDAAASHYERVLGFSRFSILVAFLLESLAIALIGAAIGIVLALPLNFISTGTSNWVTFSEIAFNFRVTADLMLFALIFGAIIGLIGSLLPSIRASRFKIVDALRA